MSKHKILKGVLFDVDGTLIDSNRQHASAWVEAFHEVGYKIPHEKVFRAIGMGADNLLPALAGTDSKSDEGKKLSSRCEEIFMQKYLSQVKPFPQARELLERCRDRGLKIGLATSSKPDALQHIMDIIGIKGLVDEAADSGSVKKSKPDSDIITSAAAKIELQLSEVVMVGDTPYDIEAARKVGVDTICVTCGGWTEAELQGAVAIYKNPEDFVERFADSILIERSET